MFQEEVVRSEYVEEQTMKFANMPSYNPEAEDRLRESIRQSAAQKQTVQQDDPTSVKAQRYYSYYQLQAWLEQVGTDMQQHRQIIKDVYKLLDKRIQISNRSIQNLINFIKTFVQHERQNIEYLKNKNTDLVKLFQDGQTSYYPKLNETIKEICNYDQGTAMKIISLLDGIDKFIKEKLDFNIEMFETGISGIRESYRKSFSVFASSSNKLTKYRKKHQALYAKQMSGEQNGKDLYHTERKLINAFLDVAKLQKVMGMAVSKLYDEVRKQEIYRYEIVITSLRMYLDKHVQLTQSKQQQISAQEELIYALLNQLQSEQVVTSFEVQTFIGQQLLKTIEKMRGKSNITISDLQEFMTNYPDTYIKLGSVQENNTLIKLRIKDAQIDCGSVLKTWKPCYIIATIDNNLLIYLKDTNEFRGKFHFSLSNIVQKTRMPLTAELIQTKPGFIFDSTTKAFLQLDAADFDAVHGLLFKEAK